jgi:hypothetical protein
MEHGTPRSVTCGTRLAGEGAVHVLLADGALVVDTAAVHWLSHPDSSLEMVGGSRIELAPGTWRLAARRLEGGRLLVEYAAAEVAA